MNGGEVRSRSRLGSNISDSLERLLRTLKTHAHKVQRHMSAVEGLVSGFVVDEREMAERLLDGIRLLALLAGAVQDYADLVPEELQIACHIVMEEHEKFSGFLLGVLQNKRLAALQEINWYRIVLSAELVIPRLFLLTSVGAAYLSLPEALFGRCIQGCRGMSTKEQLLANVQKNFLAVCDPVMGICMRPSLYRLLGRHLHTGSVAEEDGSHWHLSIQASIDCLMQEFVIANRLWVRHRYAISDRVEPDRRQMQHLVAQSIRMMAALPGLCVDRYRSAILRVLLEHIVASRDEMAQEYLTFVILEAFPIGFHVETIVDLLDAISRYLLTVDIKLLVSTVIDRILVRPKDGEEEAAEEPNGHGKVFDELWEKISGLLLLRVKTSQAEETILLCTPLLHYALEMRPLKPARVDAILKFIHISINQASAYVEEARISLTVRRIVDLVLELIADVKYIFDLPHLFMLLTDVEAANGASLGLSLVGKLGEIKYQTGEDAEHARLLEIATVIIREKGGGHIFKEEDNYEEMVESVKILKFLGETLFAGVLAGHLDQSMRQFANVILADGNILAASVLLPIATEVLLCSLDNIALIKETLHRWRRFAATTAPVHLISQAMVEERPEDVRTDLGYFVRDAPFKALVMTWRRLMEAGASTAAASDLVYESIVEIVTIFEEDVTDHRAQMDILLLVVEALGGVGRVIARPDMNVLLGKMHGYSKRLLRTEERTRMLFELLELSVMLGDQAERRLVGEVYASLSRLISAEISDATVLAHQVRMNRALVKYMMATEPITELGREVYSSISQIELFAAQNAVDSVEMREEIEMLLQDWSEVGGVLRPAYEATEMASIEAITAPLAELGMEGEPLTTGRADEEMHDKDGARTNAFASFDPELDEF